MKSSIPSQNKTKINEALLGSNEENLCAQDLKYEHIYDSELDTLRNVHEIIGSNLDYIFRLRSETRNSTEENARFRCMSCKKPLVLLSTSEKSGFYFKHKHNNANCPLKDDDSIPPHILRAMKFKGNQESKAHFYMKHLLCGLLKKDARFSNIKIENVEKNTLGDWRKPDVSAEFQKEKVVFEIQLSTELLDTIDARRNFYISKGILLIWVFQKFSFDKARISDLDILYSNNNNVIVLDEESVNKSFETNELHLSCFWREAHVVNDNITYKQNEGIFNFGELRKDFEKSHIFNYNFNVKDKNARDDLFCKLWEEDVDISNNEAAINILKKCYNITTQIKYKKVVKLIYAIFVAKKREMCGWNYKEIVQLFDLLIESHKEITFIFMIACDLYGCNFKHNRDMKKQKVVDSILLSTPQKYSPYIPQPEHVKEIEEILEQAFPALYLAYKNKLQNLHNSSIVKS